MQSTYEDALRERQRDRDAGGRKHGSCHVQDRMQAQGSLANEMQQLPENVQMDDEPAEDRLTADAIPCDTLAATLLLKSQFPSSANTSTVPFALRSQLYTIVNDRTVVDRELDMLR